MDVQTVVANALGANQSVFIDKALGGLTDADLATCPIAGTNPIGWTLWHQYRVEDGLLSNIGNKSQTWVEDGWHAKFGMEANPGQMGIGDTAEQVAAFKPSVENLKGYGAAVRAKTLEVLNSLTAEDLDREIPGPGGQPRKVGDMLGILMLDHFHHSGQVCYLRGCITQGWAPM